MTITAKFNGRCAKCGVFIPAGAQIDWVRGFGASHVNETECEAARAKAKPVQPAAPTTVDGTAIIAFLTAAKERGLKFPKARFLAADGVEELRLSLAGAQARIPGSITVVVAGAWKGRITAEGDVHGPLRGDGPLLSLLLEIATDPAKHAKAYGALMARCSFCALPLSDAGSVEVGYGPTCAARYGLPHEPKGSPELLPMVEEQAVA
jgi:hypothetical protein